MKLDFLAKKQFGLIGCPLGHSMSAVIHKELFKISKTDANYMLIEVPTEELKETFDSRLKNLCGFNVTIPHKINIIPFLDRLSPKASLFGSVNTVDVREDKIIGYNTDCSGFLRALEMAGIELKGKVLLCGAGGVSRMIAFESVLADCDLTIAVRQSSLQSANTIKDEIRQKLDRDCRVAMLDEISGGYDLIVNGTPVGMYPKIDACPVAEDVIKSSKAVYDVIYNPIKTKLIQCAESAGIKCSGGLSMLVWQAAVAEEIWNGVKFSYDDINKVIAVTERELSK